MKKIFLLLGFATTLQYNTVLKIYIKKHIKSAFLGGIKVVMPPTLLRWPMMAETDTGGCLVPGDTQGQAGWSSMQPDLAVGVPVHCRGVGLDDF